MNSYKCVSHLSSQNLDVTCARAGCHQVNTLTCAAQPAYDPSLYYTGQLSPTYLCLCDAHRHITVLPVAS